MDGVRTAEAIDVPGYKTAPWSVARGLAGKPLAGFRATPSRRIPVLCGMIAYVMRFNNQLLHR